MTQHQENGQEVGNKIIQTQSTGVVVKEEQHHQGHQVHDDFHIGHSRLLRHGLLPGSHFECKRR